MGVLQSLNHRRASLAPTAQRDHLASSTTSQQQLQRRRGSIASAMHVRRELQQSAGHQASNEVDGVDKRAPFRKRASVSGASLHEVVPGRRRFSYQDNDVEGDLAAFASALEECQAALTHRIELSMESIAELLEQSDVAQRFEAALDEVFGALSRDACNLAKALSNNAAETSRENTKARAAAFQVKLEHSRKAADISLKNKSIELGAAYQKKLSQTLRELNQGGSTLLCNAQEAQERLEKELAEEKRKHETCRESLRLALEASQASEERVSEADAARERMVHDVDETRQMIWEALLAQCAEVEGFDRENRILADPKTTALRETIRAQRGEDAVPLAEQLAGLAQANLLLKQKIQGKLLTAAESRDRMLAALAEAAGEVDRASLVHAEECKRLTEQMARRMRAEQQEMMAGRASTFDVQLLRLLAELKAMSVSHAEMEAELESSASQSAQSRQQVKFASAQLRQAREDLASANAALEEKEATIRSLRGNVGHQPPVQARAQEPMVEQPRPRTPPNQSGDEEAAATKELRKQLCTKVEEADLLRANIQQVKQSLAEACSELGIKVVENDTLSEQLRSLVAACGSAKSTTNALTETLAKASTDAQAASARLCELKELLAATQEQARERVRWQGEAEQLRTEIDLSRHKLAEALSSVKMLESDRHGLSEQFADLTSRFRVAEAALAHTSAQLGDVTGALENVTVEMGRRAEVAREERAALVRASLESLQQLRGHLTFTLVGLRVHQVHGDAASFEWKRSAGLISAKGDPMIVGFAPSGLQSLVHPGTTVAAMPGRCATDGNHARPVSALPPVHVAPATAPYPPEVWHSDIPANPLCPTRRAGKQIEVHRWGASPRPPAHPLPHQTYGGRAAVRRPATSHASMGRRPRAATLGCEGVPGSAPGSARGSRATREVSIMSTAAPAQATEKSN